MIEHELIMALRMIAAEVHMVCAKGLVVGRSMQGAAISESPAHGVPKDGVPRISSAIHGPGRIGVRPPWGGRHSHEG